MQKLKRAIRELQMKSFCDPSLDETIGPLGHAYPWQLLTRALRLQLTARLEQSFPADELRREFDAILEAYAPKQQFGQYHLGGWTGVALHAVDGDPLEDRDIPGRSFAKTPALRLAPCMETIIDSFPCAKKRVRLLQLAPGRKVFWHRDFWHSVDSTQLRLHVPIVTNPDVRMQVSHDDCPWRPGELWYGDFTFPHRLQNGGDAARVHLVVDLVNEPAARALLPDTLNAQRARRIRARAWCNRLMTAWNHAFATESRLVATTRRRNANPPGLQ